MCCQKKELNSLTHFCSSTNKKPVLSHYDPLMTKSFLAPGYCSVFFKYFYLQLINDMLLLSLHF